MKILVTGATGLVGHNFVLAARRRGHAVTGACLHPRPDHPTDLELLAADLSDADALTAMILEDWPDAIVNAAAVSSPGAVDRDAGHAERINVALPRRLAQLSTHIGARFLHLSSDMVFDGGSGSPYRSTDLPQPTTLYGRQKLQAEREVLEHNPEDPVILRITIVMGNSPGGTRSVHERLLDAIHRGETPDLFIDEMRQPCSAENLAEVMVELCERRDLHGIFHWAGSDPVNRYELGRLILDRFDLPEERIRAVRKNDRPDFRDRPSDLRMILHPLEGKLKTRPATLAEQLEELEIPDHLYAWHRQHTVSR